MSAFRYRSGKVIFLLAAVAGFLTSCSREPKFENFDSERWVGDKMGCKGERLEMLDAIYEIRGELPGLKHAEIVGLLGRPDKTELYSRGQRIYRYQIAPAEACETRSNEEINMLEIRFNALGIVSEANITLAAE